MRENFRTRTKETIAKRAGFKCSNPSCRKLTVGSHDDQNKSTIVGVAAHITAASVGGPRFNVNLTSDERLSIDNSIWLCVNCSTLIDKDPGKFSTEILRKWRQDVESETALELEGGKQKITKKIEEFDESLDDKLEKINIKRQQEFERRRFLNNPNIQDTIRMEIASILLKLKEIKPRLDKPEIFETLPTESWGDEMYGFGFKGYFLRFTHYPIELYNIEKDKLRVSFVKKRGHQYIDYTEVEVMPKDYQFDRDLSGNNGWSNYNTGNNFIKTVDLINEWVSKFIKYMENA